MPILEKKKYLKNYLYFHIKKLDKVEHVKPKVSRKKNIFKREEQKSMKHNKVGNTNESIASQF